MNEPFTRKYDPKNGGEVIGQDKSMLKLKSFLVSYKSQKKKAALLHGPLGTGKTCAVHALAKELNFDLIELNSSQLRNKAAIDKFLNSALGQMSLFMKPKLILIDEVDNFSGRKDRGGVSEIAKIISKSNFPVIFTANEAFESKLSKIRKQSLILEFAKIDYEVMAKRLMEICELEGINYEISAINSLARQSDGDFRSALIDLQSLSFLDKICLGDVVKLDDRGRSQKMLQALKVIFKSSSIDVARFAFNNVDIDANKIMLWLDKNVPREYFLAEELNDSYYYLSKADIFNRRIRRRQHWRYLVYIYAYLSAGISISKKERNPKQIEYEESRRPLKIWMAKNKLMKKRDIANKLATTTHISKKAGFKTMPYFETIFKKGGPELREKLGEELSLSSEEITWLLK